MVADEAEQRRRLAIIISGIVFVGEGLVGLGVRVVVEGAVVLCQ